MRNEEFVNYLGVDYEKKGGYLRITCPFHQDSHPSMLIYPEIERGAYCFPCGTACSWAWLAHNIKGIPYAQALKDLGQETLEPSKVKNRIAPPPAMGFCPEPKKKLADAFTEKHNACSTEWPDKMVKWLKDKKLYEVAKELDWRWHSGSDPKFKYWGDGIVIPYKWKDIVVYERFRAWNGAKQKFDKPKGPFDVPIQPYFSTFRPNNVVMIAEGESDCASLYAHGASAIGIPGASAKKAINTVVAFICDHCKGNGGFIETVVACGDKDEAGRNMNQLIRQAVMEICSRVDVIEYTPESVDQKADINDDHIAGLLKVPMEWIANHGENYNRQPWADKDFGKFVDKIAERDAAEEELIKFIDDWEKDPSKKDKNFLDDPEFQERYAIYEKLDEGLPPTEEIKKKSPKK